MSFDNAYEALTEDNDTRWAFGTGFADPLAGIDTTVPSGVDAAELARSCLWLGDDALIMSHRLQEWCASAPELEDEVALANIALDLLGQARLLLARAAKADPSLVPAVDQSDEDALAFFRDAADFRNVRLVELGGGDFAFLMARLLVFSTWRLAVFQRLAGSPDQVVAAIAAKGIKELAYHRDYAARWVVRLGDGTDLSHERMQAGLDAVWPYVDELFDSDTSLRAEFDAVMSQVITAGALKQPPVRQATDTGQLEPLLAEMQSVARAYPDATW
ncbi:1,2-phenylacetyl-CoA epoxidase subunit PaaC [Kibdelosporangium phytohabitans]|uniref:Phenylacetate-CoA oxygenase n=1 Tax=Kibdelosporangium phytohabitans TaxID=860235 RepID=A0A0N7F2Y5_9PSEU|nr:1,2-phenylacetyl-CoA epoxidase subunit PaaC [Kibdelosporangium phytohabitans]ALG07127.1 phenylacetate-CoA oxygenase [Kibdelosporangium phytohabitans]MBE1468448.1 ring-1,2-phenylacetyl-CoA epoxidase subunit PaaC [Kibdelosporangium phytohabitans]